MKAKQASFLFTPARNPIGNGSQVLIALHRVKHRDPKPRRPLPLEAYGAKVIEKDDYPALPKRSYTVLIPYESEGRGMLWARFGGLTRAIAEALVSSHNAHMFAAGETCPLDQYNGRPVVEWPSELIRQDPYNTKQVQGYEDGPWQNVEVS